MMLGCQHDVSRACLLKQHGPFFWMPTRGPFIEGVRELVIIEILAVSRNMVLVCWRAGNSKRVQIPFGVRIVREPLGPLNFPEFTRRRRPSRNRIQTPVDKDAEFRILKLLGSFVLINRVPSRFVFRDGRRECPLLKTKCGCSGHAKHDRMKLPSIHLLLQR